MLQIPSFNRKIFIFEDDEEEDLENNVEKKRDGKSFIDIKYTNRPRYCDKPSKSLKAILNIVL